MKNTFAFFMTVFVVGLFVLTASTDSFAQRNTEVNTIQVLDNHTFSLMPGEVVRFVIANQPTRNAGRNQDGVDDVIVGTVAVGHVKASTWTGNIVLTSDATIGPGQISTIEIKYSDLPGVEADSNGRRKFRVDVTIDVAGSGPNAPTIRPILKSKDGGKTWIIGMLLPAVQKVRE